MTKVDEIIAAAELGPQTDLPGIHATQGDLHQLIAMLAGDPENDEDFADASVQVNVDDDDEDVDE